MGIRGEEFSTRVSCEGRTYFFNVKRNRMGDTFLTVVESKPTEAETFDRRSIVIFRDDLPEFLKAFQSTLKYLEKSESAPPEMRYEPEPAAPRRRPAGRGSASGAADGAAEGGAPARKRRVVVKKKPAEGEGGPAD